jgi:D-serine deaminase-like pyridoxal phosphate-dependent protein
MKLNENWYEFRQSGQIDSPALVVYLQRVKENIRVLKSMVDDSSKLRPHIKTSKAKEPVLLMMKEGITKFKCATIAEAEMLAMCGVTDVLVAYQPTETKLQRFIKLIKNYPGTGFSCLVDNFQSATLFSTTAMACNVEIFVYIDLNVGMDRTGITPNKEALDLFEAMIAMPHLKFLGFHAYDGHIRETNFQERKQVCDACFEIVEQLREKIKSKGYDYPLLIAGGSPTFQIHLQRKNVEVSPGTFIFWDKGYADNIPEQNFLFGALVLTRVISLPAKNKICIDLGYKSIASENDLQHRVFILNAPHLKPVSHSEEHMVLDAGAGHGFKIGDILYALPVHICPTVALYKHAVCISHGDVSGKWEITARDREICF